MTAWLVKVKMEEKEGETGEHHRAEPAEGAEGPHEADADNAPPAGEAREQGHAHLEGVIKSIGDGTLVLIKEDGSEVSLTLAPSLQVKGVDALADLSEGMRVEVVVRLSDHPVVRLKVEE